MNHYHKKIYCLFILAVFLPISTYSQIVPESRIKAEFILVLPPYITWPNESELDTFRIGILGADKVFSELEMKAGLDYLKNKPVSVERYRRARDTDPLQVLFVGDVGESALRRVFRRFGDQPVLIITGSFPHYE